MLEITVPSKDLWDNEKEQFVFIPKTTLVLEHSLISLKKWESKWHKPFFDTFEQMTNEEIYDYIRCMFTKNYDPNVVYALTSDNVTAIGEYISNPMSATKIYEPSNESGKLRGEIVTAELVYYWMIALKIPFECQRWHLNSLMMLIKVCMIKNQPEKKMTTRQILARNRELNEARKKTLNTKG